MAAAPESETQPVGESGTGATVPLAALSSNWHGWLKADALLIQNGCGPPSMVLVLTPSCASPTFRALQPPPVFVPFKHPMLRGCPPWSVRIQFVAQPPRIMLERPAVFKYFFPLPKG